MTELTTAPLRVAREGDPPPPRRHLLAISDLDRNAVERLLGTATTIARSLDREVKKLPALRGRLVVNLFYESSTRTLSSFDLAAKRLSADTMALRSSGSSVDKGESLKDTALTLAEYDPDVIVIRHPHIGAPELVASVTHAHVVNAGDGKHQHPDAGAARPLHDARGARAPRRASRRHRRRRAPLAGRAVADRGARARRRAGDARRAADAHPARHRVDGLRGVDGHRGHRGSGRRLRPADAAGAHERRSCVRAVAARVRRGVGGHRAPTAPGPDRDAPGADEPRRRDRSRRRRLRRVADHRAGALRPRRADGRALRPAGRWPGETTHDRWRSHDTLLARRPGRQPHDSRCPRDRRRRRHRRRLRRHHRGRRDHQPRARGASPHPASSSRRPSSIRTCTSGCPAARTRRRSRRAPRQRPPAATARSWRCRTPTRSSTRLPCSVR